MSRELTGENQNPLPTASAVSLRKRWSVGIYTGDSPLRLCSPPELRNPVLSFRDVSDIRAGFVADPFMVVEDGLWHMFFEVLNEEVGHGEIGLAVSGNGLKWEYREIVLRESFHLSYPYVFKWEDEHYMIPETLAVNSICLYRATRFPTHWARIGTLISGRCADPSLFRFDSRWWMFACSPVQRSDTLRLYYSDHLTTSWQEHPVSPVVEGDARIARPGGRVILHDGRPIRFTQDCYDRYGSQVRAFEITELTPTSYVEREDEASPVLCAASDGWNSSGMHHVDAHLMSEGRWIACVDGLNIEGVEEPASAAGPEASACD